MNNNSSPNFHSKFANSLQVLLLSVWVAHKGPTLQQNNESTKNASAEDGEKSDWELLQESVEVTINRFAKLAQRGMMSLCVCVVCHTLREIAAAPDSEPKRLLTKMIPHKMVRLAGWLFD